MSTTAGLSDPHLATPSGKPRARAVGVPFEGTPGGWNAITDVPGVEVGYATVIRGEDVRTGVTAIHPRGRSNPGDPCAAGFFSQNGNGEMTGTAWIEESGTASLPVTITNTHAVGIAHEATIRWAVERFPELGEAWLLPVAAETWDGYLNDINGGQVTREVVIEALDAGRPGAIELGSVGGGTGMNCYGFKGGNGSASRLVDFGSRTFTVGVFLQCNFGSRHELRIAGAPVGQVFADDDPLGEWSPAADGAGSVIGVVITDAPLLPQQCKAMARRVPLGLARTGTTGSHFSGDLFLALSTANAGAFATGFPPAGERDDEISSIRFIPWGRIDPLYAAVVAAVEEAVVDALVANDEMTGRSGHRTPALPRERLAEVVRGDQAARS
ncbi:MAG: D-aminopeptidase [Gaiellales bacterium]|nr:D-aminopeptidase [Gaiellales bacterium]